MVLQTPRGPGAATISQKAPSATEGRHTRSLHSRNPKTERCCGGHGLAFEGKPLDIYSSIAENNKLMKTITDAATITRLAAGMGWLAKKVLKEQFTGDQSASVVNYVKMTAAVATSLAVKDSLEDKKTIPKAM